MAAISFGTLEPSRAGADPAPTPETPFRMAILSDFSGRASRGEKRDADALAKLKGVAVSRDTLEDTMARLKVSLNIPLPDETAPAKLTFQSLDEFHPDEVYGKIDKFEDLDDDDEKSALMKAVLHHGAFQNLESAWRGLDWLLKRVHKTGSGIEVVLFDVTFDELSADLAAGENLAATGLYRCLLAPLIESGKGQPWAALVGLYTFDFTPERISTLGRLAKFAGVAAAPFLSAASPRVLDQGFELDADATAAWAALRKLPEAALAGLVTPRFLMRQPFGENTKSIDRFSFEEIEPKKSKAGYLWANPALGAACLLGLSFIKESWGFQSGGVLDLDDLPMHVWRDEDGDEQLTVAEAWLERKTTERLVKLGLMPLLSVRGKNALQLFRFVSLAEPPKGQQAADLVGRWGQKGTLKVPRSVGVRGGGSVSLMGGAAPPPPPAAKPPQPAQAGDEASPPADNQSSDAPAVAAADAPPPPAAEEGMDPELAAMLKELEAPAAAPAPEAAPPPPAADEGMDPELAAMLKELEAPAPAAAPPPAAEPPPPAADEGMDPELAALLQQLETPAPAGGGDPAGGAPAAAPPPVTDEELDPELAALLNEVQQGVAENEPPAPEPPAEPAEEEAEADDEMDPELAALLEQLESEGEPEAGTEVPATASAATVEPTAETAPTARSAPADEGMDPDLAAMLNELGGGEAAAAPAPTAAPKVQPVPAPAPVAALAPAASAASPTAQPASTVSPAAANRQAEIDGLGGRAALDKLGWPVFAPAFMKDHERLVHILKGSIKNSAVNKEVADLVKKCGGYPAVAGDGVRADMGLNEQASKLRALRKVVEDDDLLKNQELAEMAEAYGANLKKLPTPKAKSELLAQVRDYDKWASDGRNAGPAAALDGCPFKERRQAQLEQQLTALGGDNAFADTLKAHPANLDAKAAPDTKIAILKAIKDYTKLGGDQAFGQRVGNDSKTTPLLTKLDQLKSVLAAQE